jgi:hypothetical protein
VADHERERLGAGELGHPERVVLGRVFWVTVLG